MKLFRIPALLLAAALQLFPLCRSVCTNPAVSSTLAIICRWVVGAGAALGAYDAYSAGSTVYFDGAATAVGTVGVPFTYYITLGGQIGGDSGSIIAGAPLPTGFTNYTQSHLSPNPVAEWGVITGIPTSVTNNMLINLAASNPQFQSGVPIVGSLRLTILASSTPVVITSNPTNVIVNNGQSVTLSVAASGTGPFTYQWFKQDTNIWSHIQSATNSFYTFIASTNSALPKYNPNGTSSGVYLVRVAGAAGMVTTQPATVIVNSAALSITAPPTNLTVNVGDTANFSVTAAGSTTLGYQWYRNATNRLTGATASTFSLGAVQLTNAANYTVVVTNASGALTSSIAALTVISNASVAPSITTQPTNQIVLAGQPASFVAVAAGTAPLSYQWLLNNTNFSSAATNSTLSFANVRASDAGTYSVVVSNSVNSVTSSNAVLTVNLPAAPTLASSGSDGTKFYFTFTPVVGLTNTVLTNSDVGAGWGVLTNIPPPGTAASITVTDIISGGIKFYRAVFSP